MSKIGLITIVDYNNYGNRLQNLAMQDFFQSKGFQVETIRNIPPKRKINLITRMKISCKYRIRRFLHLKKYKEREKNFMEFTHKYIAESKFIVRNYVEDHHKLYNYDKLIIGSDQIWNPNFRNMNQFDFAKGINLPRVAVSASFGVSYLSLDIMKEYSVLLNELDAISVRENDGQKIIYEAIGKKVPVLADPTLIKTADEWRLLMNTHVNKPSREYILIYSLGGVSDKVKRMIELINNNEEYEVVDLGTNRDYRYFDAGPSEFLDYIASAKLLITDSYHGTIFSIIFQTPFIVFNREDKVGNESMNSRLNTLLEKFQMNSRRIELVKSKNVFNLDFGSSALIIESEQKKFNEFYKSEINNE